MTLPFPHGTTSGDIGHNANIDLTDTPGSTGGRFIGFGEEGISSIANRAHWALSANIDHCHDALESDLAVRAGDAFTVGGGGQSSRQITGDVFVGDSGYPTGTPALIQAGMNLLFSVLDENYDELTDPTNGEQVFVKEVRDSTDVSDVYRTDFEVDPYVHFATASTDPYTIPAAQEVIILHGIKSSLEALPVDALTKFTVQSAEEVQAGTLLQDGSRPMTGNLDIDSNDIINPAAVTGAAAADLQVSSAQVLELVAATDLTLKDTNLSAAVPLSETAVASLYSPGAAWTSLVGALNSKTRMASINGNRVLDVAGSVTFTGGSGQVDYPTLNVCLGGEYVVIAAGNVSAPAASARVLVVTAAGSVAQRDTLTGVSGDIPIAYYQWDGVAAFDFDYDIRQSFNSRTASFEITVGNALQGAQFSTLLDAIAFSNAVAKISGLDGVPKTKIRVLNDFNLFSPITIEAPVIVEGNMWSGAAPYVSCSAFTTAHLINCAGYKVEFRNLNFTWDHSSDVASGYGAFADPGSDSIFENLNFDTNTNIWANIFVHNSNNRYNIRITNCLVDGVDEYFIDGGTYFHQAGVKHCNLINTVSSTSDAIDLRGNNNLVEQCDIAGYNGGVLVGNRGRIVGNRLYSTNTLRAGAQFATTGTGPMSAAIRDNQITGYSAGVYVGITTAVTADVNIEGNTLLSNAVGIQTANDSNLDADSMINILYNTIDSSTFEGIEAGVIASYVGNLRIIGNRISNATTTAIKLVGYSTSITVSKNYVPGYGSGAGDSALSIDMTSISGNSPLVSDNQFYTAGASTSSVVVLCDEDWVRFHNNEIGKNGSIEATRGIYSASSRVGIKMVGNTFANLKVGVEMSSNTGVRAARITGNLFYDCSVQGIFYTGGSGLRIDGNTFDECAGQGIFLAGSGTENLNAAIVSNNTFQEVVGWPGAVAAIIIEGPATNANGTLIDGNSFYNCGDVTHLTYVINLETPGVIRGNTFNQTQGHPSSAVYTACIRAAGTNILVDGNWISQSVANLMQFAAIIMNSTEGICSNNLLYLSGTNSIASAIIYGIWSGATTYVTISGNFIADWIGNGAGVTQRFIEATGDYVCAHGNLMRDPNNYGANFSGTKGMFTGNRIVGGATSLNIAAAHYPAQGAVVNHQAEVNSANA